MRAEAVAPATASERALVRVSLRPPPAPGQGRVGPRPAPSRWTAPPPPLL